MTNVLDINEVTLELLSQDIPDLNNDDLLNLISNLEKLSDQLSMQAESEEDPSESLNKWIPKRTTIKEIINNRIKVTDIPFCIDDFKSFAKTKGWSARDNLDAKFIVHIKIMVSNSKIFLQDPVSDSDTDI